MKIDDKVHVVLKQPGYQNYSGYLLAHRFVDGKTVEPIPIQQALRLGAAYICADENGTVISPNTIVYSNANETSADVKASSPSMMEKEAAPVEEAEDDVMEFLAPNDEMSDAKTWTPAELEALADAEGIQGLRDIGDELGVKERSIKGLIEGIVKAQSGVDKLAGDE